jgi:hypothetical protein
MIDGVPYYYSIKVKKGQESMPSARMAQVDDEIAAEHFGLPGPASAGSRRLPGKLTPFVDRSVSLI